MVRAKMKVTELIKRTSNYGTATHESSEVTLSAVSGPGNETWSKWTPGGSVKLTITNPAALEQFKIGDTCFVDFTPAPATEAEEAKAD